MYFLLFNKEILISDGVNVQRIDKSGNIKNFFESIDVANLCVVDADVLIAAAVESPVEKKDSILVRKFKELYQHEPYIIQDEKIDNNLFQVIGIKEQKIREVYALIPPQKVHTFIPYGIALRNTLVNRKVDLNKTVVFVDVQGAERLLTVFDGYKFSRTRVITDNGEDILPEIKRSQIDFHKKTQEHQGKKSTDFVIMVNNQELAAEISKNEEKLPVGCLNIAYPALEGLKETNTLIKYRLPEEILEKRRAMELKKNVTASMVSLCVAAVGVLFFLFNMVQLREIKNQYDLALRTGYQLDERLRVLDKEIYREDLKTQKSMNYGIPYLELLDLIPGSYEINTFKFLKTDSWKLEVSLFARDGEPFEPIPRTRILKSAVIKDTFVNNQPGKYLRITL